MPKLTNREKFDIKTMRYFLPKQSSPPRIRDYDKVKMANLSSKGIQPKRRTKGFDLLRWGKTYRDLQITYWKADIRDGIITKAEIYESLPEWLRDWAYTKLKEVPYDIKGETSTMLISMYQSGVR
jgi:hypothetical protein